ncbi:sugar phosphate isomerase/epimerase family protein [Geminisphaera colitermitum]|uniref:sugar phosphate isomerase/epimerase family protein n=1 Tax=Geminisphaera colitermitum TaxID=1148786 RepID=UPI000158C6C7|nr:sugar phosphate isomerase/epimerase [Geminisphaera colitermitum]
MRAKIIKSPICSHAFSTLGCVELSLADSLRLAARHRLDAIELRGIGGSLDVPAQLEKTFGTPEAFAAAAGANPVSICSLDTSLFLIGNIAADRDAFLRYLPWAEALGVPRLRVFDGGTDLNDAELGQALDTLSWWNDLRRANRWRADVMIETHDALTRTPAILRFLARAPSGTGLLWDTHHTWRLGGEETAATWQAIRSRVVHIHVKDSISRPSYYGAHTYVPPGQGEFAMNTLRALLARDAYAGAVSLEWERHWHPELVPLEEALASAATREWW